MNKIKKLSCECEHLQEWHTHKEGRKLACCSIFGCDCEKFKEDKNPPKRIKI